MVTNVAQLTSYSDLPLVVHPSGLLSGTKADKGWSTRQERRCRGSLRLLLRSQSVSSQFLDAVQ